MIKLILTTIGILFCAIGAQAGPHKTLQVAIDGKLARLTPSPILKGGNWLVPVEPFSKQLGLKVEYPEGAEMAVICGRGGAALCVPLQVGQDAFLIDGTFYAQPARITEPFGLEIYNVSAVRVEVVRPEQLAPAFTLPDLEGNLRQLQDFRGKKTLLYVWGSW